MARQARKHSTRLSQAHDEPGGELDERTAGEIRTADLDYPELGTVLADRPDPGRQISVIGRRRIAGSTYGRPDDARDGEYNGGENDTGMYWAEPGQQDWTEENLGPQQEAPPPPWAMSPMLARLAQVEEACQFYGAFQAGTLHRATTINGTQIDDHGDAPEHGTVPRASAPDDYDSRSTEGDGDPKWSSSLDPAHKKEFNGATVGMYPEGMSGGDGPGLPIGAFTAAHRVPWTDRERTRLHSWEDVPTAGWGDFVPSTEFTGRNPVGETEPGAAEELRAEGAWQFDYGYDDEPETPHDREFGPGDWHGAPGGRPEHPGTPGETGTFEPRDWTDIADPEDHEDEENRRRLHHTLSAYEPYEPYDLTPRDGEHSGPPEEMDEEYRPGDWTDIADKSDHATGNEGWVHHTLSFLRCQAASEEAWLNHLRTGHRLNDDVIGRMTGRGFTPSDVHSYLHSLGTEGHEHPGTPEEDRAIEHAQSLNNAFGRDIRTYPGKAQPQGYPLTRPQYGGSARNHEWERLMATSPLGIQKSMDDIEREDPARFRRAMSALDPPHEHDDDINSLDAGPDEGDEGFTGEHSDADDLDAPVPPQAWPLAGASTTEGGPAYTQGKDDGNRGRIFPPPPPMPVPSGLDDEDGAPGSSDPDDPDDPDGTGKKITLEVKAHLAAFTVAAADPRFRFEFTAAWSDVVAKAKRIRAEGHVRITHASPGVVIGEVRGDHDTYESGIQRAVGKVNSMQHWACFLPDAPVTMADGSERPISELKPGDEVLTHEGQARKVVRVQPRHYEGSLATVKFAGDYRPYVSTADHRVWAASRPGSRPRWIEIQDLRHGDSLTRTVPGGEHEIAVGLRRPALHSHPSIAASPPFVNVKIDEDLAWLLGWYVAEGHIRHDRYEIGFTLHARERDVAEELSNICKDRFGTAGSIRLTGKNKILFRVSHWALHGFVSQLAGHGAKTKKLDRRVLVMPKRLQEIFASAWLAGDGDCTSGRCTITSVSETLLRQLRDILLRLGKQATLTKQEDNKGGLPTTQNAGPIWRLRWMADPVHNYMAAERLRWSVSTLREMGMSQGAIAAQLGIAQGTVSRYLGGRGVRSYGRVLSDDVEYLEIKSLELNPFSGDVWDIEVEEDHSFRAFGVNVHNCGCPWASFHQDKGLGTRYAGRPCSHVMALQYEAQARGMFGRQVTPASQAPAWSKGDVTVKSWPPYEGDPHKGHWSEYWLAPAASLHQATPDEARDQDLSPEEREERWPQLLASVSDDPWMRPEISEILRYEREQEQDDGCECLYAHPGPCPPLDDGDLRRTAESLRYSRPKGFQSELRRNPRFDPGSYEPQEQATHVLHGSVGGVLAGKMHVSFSDDGLAAQVHMLHSRKEGRGVAAAMMDDLYGRMKQAGGWINHGVRTPEGNNWWASYREPHPEINTHHAHPGDGWAKYWDPRDVGPEAEFNHRQSEGRGAHTPAGYDPEDYPEGDRDEQWTLARGLHSPASYATASLLAAGEDQAEVDGLRSLAGLSPSDKMIWRHLDTAHAGTHESARAMDISPHRYHDVLHEQRAAVSIPHSHDEPGAAEPGSWRLSEAALTVQADQTNAPWGSENVSHHPPVKPYGATEPLNKDQDPGSYGFLAAPDPDNWGSIQEGSYLQSPLSNEALLRHRVLVPGDPKPLPPHLDYPDISGWHENQDSFGYTDRANTAGPSTAIEPRDPQGIRMEEARTAAGTPFPYHNEIPQLDGALAELRDEPEPALPSTTGEDEIETTAAADGTIGGGDAGSGEDTQAPADVASLGEFGAVRERPQAYTDIRERFRTAGTPMGDLGRETSPQAQQPSAVTQQPGMGSMDEPLMPDDQSIQTTGQQQWSGGGADSDEVAVEPGQPQGGIDDIVARFQRSAAASQYVAAGAPGGLHSDGDIASAARAFLQKTADVLPDKEAAELIAEGRGERARNLGLLRLEGTHYEEEGDDLSRRGLSLDDYDDDVISV